jgi:NADH dehydrogenase [ubiquinone] 1 alpha subcomplex assembly factor 6
MNIPPRMNNQGVITLSLDVMSTCGVREEDVLRNGPKAVGIKDAVFSVETRASDHLITARIMLESIKRSGNPGHEFEHMNDEGHEYSKYESGVRLSGDRRQEEFKKGFGIVIGPAVST